MQFDAFISAGYTLYSRKAESQLSINLWRERVQSDQGTNPFVMRRSPGLTPYIENGTTGRIRGMFEQNGHVFRIQGANLTDYIGTAVSLNYGNGLADDGKRVFMAASQTTLMLVSGGKLYRANGGTLTEITLGTGGTPLTVVFLKNYFIVPLANSDQFCWSEDDGATFPADLVKTAEADANFNMGAAVIHQQLFIIGNRITQVFYVGENPNAPFVQNDGAVIRSGTCATASVETLGDSIYWMESTKEGRYSVVRTEGYAVRQISNNYIYNKISDLALTADITDAVGQSFQLGDHQFYRLTFPTADSTLEYHATNDEWEEPLWWNRLTGTYHQHRAFSVCASGGLLLAGDNQNGVIYSMSTDEYTDYGYPLRALRRCPHIVGEANRYIAYDRLDLGCQTGVGLENPLWLQTYALDYATFVADLAQAVVDGDVTAAQALVLQDIYDGNPYTPLDPYPDADTMDALGFTPWGSVAVLSDGTVIGEPPQIDLRYSNDGGESYSNVLSRSLGQQGQSNLSVYWQRLGMAKDRVFEAVDENPCKLAWTGAWINEPEEMAH